VACYLPLTPDEGLPKEWGTRHRAALGLSERCDAWVVVVSEERGAVSVAREKEMVHVGDMEKLSQLILQTMTPISPERKSWWERVHFFLVHRWHVKVGTLFLVATLWLMLAGQQNFEKTLAVPLEITNIPSQLEILGPVNPKAEIKVRGLRKDISTLNEKNVMADIDLSAARLGRRTFSITRDHIRLPNERMYVVDIDPPQLKFEFKEKPR
jgi:diadenylate cyclase